MDRRAWIDRPSMDEVDALAGMWVTLAREQRAYGSHLYGETNRRQIREALAQHVVTDGVRVARDPDIVGFVMFGLDTGSYEQDVTCGVVRNVYVRPDRRGEGIGTALLESAERALADGGAAAVTLEAMADNEDAVRLYERLGYRPHRVELEKPLEATRDDGGGREDAESSGDAGGDGT